MACIDNFNRHHELISYIGDGQRTRSSLENIAFGFFKDKLCFYLDANIICGKQNPNTGETVFRLTPLGLKLWRQESTIEDIIKA